MSQLRGIDAEYVNWRTVMGRKVLQLVFEIDISRQMEVLTMLGTPTTGESKWVAIAPLREKPEAEAPAFTPVPVLIGSGSAASKPEPQSREAAGSPKPFSFLPLSQQAAIRCGDVLFQEFLGVMTATDAAQAVRDNCAVQSRSEFDSNKQAGAAWHNIECRFQNWLTDRKFAESKR